MSKSKGILTGGRVLAKWLNDNAQQGRLLQSIIDGVNTLADNTASSAVGRLAPPTPINGVAIKQSGEMLHIQISHSGAVQQGVRYFSEISTSGGSQPLVIDHGTSRTSHPISLPTLDDNGNTQQYTLHSYNQLPGSDPTPRVAYPGNPFTMSGTTRMTLLPSTGSGTAANTGQQAGWGLGKVLRRTK
jgi:hypothetical protein